MDTKEVHLVPDFILTGPHLTLFGPEQSHELKLPKEQMTSGWKRWKEGYRTSEEAGSYEDAARLHSVCMCVWWCVSAAYSQLWEEVPGLPISEPELTGSFRLCYKEWTDNNVTMFGNPMKINNTTSLCAVCHIILMWICARSAVIENNTCKNWGRRTQFVVLLISPSSPLP